MSAGFTRLLAEAWARLRGSADLVLAIAGPLVFLPAFAVQLLCDPLPPLPATPEDEAAARAWIEALGIWAQANGPWYVLADVVGMIGLAAVAVLLLDPARPSVGQALGSAARRGGRFVLASLLIAIPVGAGLWLFVLPGLYLQARLVMTTPILAAEPRQGAARALARSWAGTRALAWGLFGAVTMLFLAQWLAVLPLFAAEDALRAPGHGNPFVIALVAALLAAIAAAHKVALLLLGVAAYARASKGM